LRGVRITEVKLNGNDQLETELWCQINSVLLAEVSIKGGSTAFPSFLFLEETPTVQLKLSCIPGNKKPQMKMLGFVAPYSLTVA
jgi:hypothetical protein